MTRKHFEYMAAEIAAGTDAGSTARTMLVNFAEGLARKFGSQFDSNRFDARITQYDNGERNPITYLNSH